MKCVRVKDNKLFTPIIRYRKKNLECTAIGTVHVANPAYYDKLQTELNKFSEGFYEGIKPVSEGAKIPAEKKGYLDVMKRLAETYGTLAKYLGMEVQKNKLSYGKDWKNPDMTLDELIIAAPTNLLTALSNQKIKNFEGVYATHPKELSRLMKGIMMGAIKFPIVKKYLLNSGLQYKEVLLDKRNQLLFDAMKPKLENVAKGEFGVIYGTEHLRGLDYHLKQNRFKKEGEMWIPAWEINEDVGFWKAFRTVIKNHNF